MKKYFIALLYLIILTAQGVANNIIELPAEVIINSDKVYLNDIVSGLSDKVYVATAALPGFSKSITRDYVARLIKSTLKSEVEVQGTENIVIKRAGQPLDESSIKSKIYEAIISNLNNIDKSDLAIEFQDIKYNKMLPLGEVSYEIKFNKNENFRGNIIAYITILIDNKKYDNLYVRASVRVWDTVYRAKQSFRWPAKLTENDVYSEKIEITNINAELIKDINDLQNKIVKKHILPNEILTVESFSQEPIIKRGAQVKLMSKIGTVIVSTIGIAKDNGYKNQYVRVENINSNKTVRAKVIDSQTVIVE